MTVRITTVLVFAALFNQALGQTDTSMVTAVIVAENKTPMSHMNVVLKGTQLGTVTNDCGEFQLQIPKDFHSDLTISAIYPRVWEISIDKLRHKSYVTIILNETEGNTNQHCDRQISIKNKIKIK